MKIKTYEEIVNTYLIRQDRKPRTGVRNYCERFIAVDSGGGVKETNVELRSCIIIIIR